MNSGTSILIIETVFFVVVVFFFLFLFFFLLFWSDIDEMRFDIMGAEHNLKCFKIFHHLLDTRFGL